MTTPSPTSTRSGVLPGGSAAIVFAVLFVVGFLLTTDTPDGDESNLKWIRHYADSGNRRMIIIGVIVLALAAIAFLIFLSVLRERLRAAAPGSEWLATIAFASGIVFGDAPVPRDADIMRTLVSVGFGFLLVFGAASAGLLIFVTSIVSGRAALFPRWFVVTGYVVGVIVFLGGLLFIPIILLVLWMLAIGIVMLSRSGAAA